MIKLKETVVKGEPPLPAINANDFVTKSRPGSVGSMCSPSVTARPEKGSEFALRGSVARGWSSEIDQIRALQACMIGFQVTTLET